MLTTPDANRTFLSYLGESHALTLSAAAQQAIKASRMLVVEGYMWEANNALETLSAAASFARSHGAMVVLTAGDMGVVKRHTAGFWQMLKDGVDMLFCNRCASCSTPCLTKKAHCSKYTTTHLSDLHRCIQPRIAWNFHICPAAPLRPCLCSLLACDGQCLSKHCVSAYGDAGSRQLMGDVMQVGGCSSPRQAIMHSTGSCSSTGPPLQGCPSH